MKWIAPTAAQGLQLLWQEGFFRKPQRMTDIIRRFSEADHHYTNIELGMALKRAKYLIRRNASGGHEYIQRHQEAIPDQEKIRSKGDKLFSDSLRKKLKRYVSAEIEELEDNFAKNGNSTAFLLRKILEKLIIIVFSKNEKGDLLEDVSRPGGWKGLAEIIDIATRERVEGLPFLTGKTGEEIKGIKFLGDTAAHNPLVDVNIRTILPQMPFIITAYEELAKRL